MKVTRFEDLPCEINPKLVSYAFERHNYVSLYSQIYTDISQGKKVLTEEGIKSSLSFFLYPKDHVVKSDLNRIEPLTINISLKTNLMTFSNVLKA